MMAITFEIHALEPLLIARLEGDPNSSVSYPYVPGSVIRGALANRYLHRHDVDLATDPVSRRLFFAGAGRYLNAYPLDEHGVRTLPTPLSWYHDKQVPLDEGELVYDFAVSEYTTLEEPKSVAKPFSRLFKAQDVDEDDEWEPEPAAVAFAEPDWHINVHTARERTKGRATEEEGAVFRYQAIAAGERFGGVIIANDADDLKTLTGMLDGGDLWLGGSRSGGYGRARIEAVQVNQDWQETDTYLIDAQPGHPLIINLLSDVIQRTPGGAHADVLTSDALPPEVRAGVARAAQAAYKRVAPVGGFNRKWGLPTVQAPAIQAGSVFVFDVVAPIPSHALSQLQDDGIGERRVEGFGRIAVNSLVEPQLTVRKAKMEPDDAAPIVLSGDSQALAQTMVERMLQSQLDRLLAQRVNSEESKIDPPPSNAQLSRLRTIVLNALPEGDLNRVSAFLSDDNLKARARQQFWRARIGGVRLLEWLRARLEGPETVWGRLSEGGIAIPSIGDVEAELTDALAKTYTLRLIEGVLHQASKER